MPFQKMNIQTGMEIGRRLSWGGIFAGLLVILAIQTTLSFLGACFGLMTMSPYTGALPMEITSGTGLWWILTTILAYFLGGWVAGHLRTFSTAGALHGIGTWAATTVVSVILMTALFGGTGTAGAAALSQQAINNSPIGMPGTTEQQADVDNARAAGPAVREMPSATGSGLNPRSDVQTARHAAARTAFWAFLASTFGALSAAWGGAQGARGRVLASENTFRELEHRQAA